MKDISNATMKLMQSSISPHDSNNKGASVEDVQSALEEALSTGKCPPVDLLIRTAGNVRGILLEVEKEDER